jgi:hypothetical protein
MLVSKGRKLNFQKVNFAKLLLESFTLNYTGFVIFIQTMTWLIVEVKNKFMVLFMHVMLLLLIKSAFNAKIANI